MLLNCGVGEDSWKSLDCKEIQPVSPKGNQSWIFIERTDAEAETPILWQPDVKNWLNGKDPGAGKDCRQEEKEMTEDGMVGWHYWFNGHEFEQALGIGDGQESLVCYSPRVAKSQTKLSSWTKLNFNLQSISLSKLSHSSTDNLGIHSTTFQEQRFPERKAKKKRASQLCQSVPHGIPA